MRLHADDLRGGLRPLREVEAGAAADVEEGASGPVGDLAHRSGDAAVRVGGPVLELVELGGVPDVGGGPGRVGQPQIRTSPFGRLQLDRDDAGGAVGGDPLDLDVLQRGLDGLAEPLAHALRVAGDLEAGQRVVAGRAVAGVQVRRRLPVDEVGELRVVEEAVDADLLPEQLGAVGAVAVALDGLSAQARLDRGDVVDGDDPAHPAAAEGGAGAHGLAERGLVAGGVVEHLDDLEVDVAGERQDHVAGAEAGVHASGREVRAEQPPDALGGAGESIRSGGEADVVQAHAEILCLFVLGADTGVGFS